MGFVDCLKDIDSVNRYSQKHSDTMTNRENVETSSNLLSSEKSDTKATTAPPEGRVGIGWRFWVFVAAYFMFNLFQGI